MWQCACGTYNEDIEMKCNCCGLDERSIKVIIPGEENDKVEEKGKVEDKICPTCGTINPSTAKYCRKDGTPFKKADNVIESVSIEKEMIGSPATEDEIKKTNLSEGKDVPEGDKKEGKICPKCKVIYPPKVSYCKKDGTPLGIIDMVIEDTDIKKEIPSGVEEKGGFKKTDSSEEKTIPIIKKIPQTEGQKRNIIFYQVIPPVGGFLLTLILMGIVSLIFSPESFCYRIFLPSGDWYQKVVPFTIVFLCSWSLLLLVFKLREILVEKKSFEKMAILNLSQSVHVDGVKVTVEKLSSHKQISKGRSFKRIISFLEQLDMRSDIQKSYEFIRHQFEIESDTAAAKYTVVRIFIWAMPILGFIGTVIGISFAVGDFSIFLRGSGENIEIESIKEQLANVANGLSYAFDTTFLGLVACLPTMFLISYVQNQEEGFFTDVEDMCLKILSKWEPDAPLVSGKATNDPGVDPSGSFQKEIKLFAEEISVNLKSFTDNFAVISQGLSRDLSEIPTKLQKEGKEIKEMISDLQNFKQVLGTILENNNEQLRRSLDLLSSYVKPLHATLDANIQTINILNSFSHVLNELQKTQKLVIPLLSKLSGPLEFKLVPSQLEDCNIQMSANPSKPEIKEGE